MRSNQTIKDSKIIPVILCGGSGTRLWPLSRESYPKQFISLSSDTKNSLLQKTQLRINIKFIKILYIIKLIRNLLHLNF